MSDAPTAELSDDERVSLFEQVEDARRRVNDPSHPIYGADPQRRDQRLVELTATLRRAGIGEADEKPPTVEQMVGYQLEDAWPSAHEPVPQATLDLLAGRIAAFDALSDREREWQKTSLVKELGFARYNALVADAEAAIPTGLFGAVSKVPPQVLGDRIALELAAGRGQYWRAFERAKSQVKL